MTTATPVRRRAAAAAMRAPDFSGLTRIEWTVQSLGLGHLDTCASWADVGPNRIELAQGTAMAQPQFRLDGELGACLRFDASDDELSASGLNLDMSGGLSVFLLIDRSSTNANLGPLSMKTTAAAHTAHAAEFYNGAAATQMNMVANRDATIGFWVMTDAGFGTTATLLAIRMDATISPDEGAVRRDGADADTVTVSGTPRGPDNAINVISTHGYNSAKFGGDIYAILIYYGRDMTLAEAQQVERNLNHRFRVY